MPQWPGFIGGSGQAQTLVGDSADTVNLYVEKLDTGAQALLPSPGFSAWTAAVADVGARAALNASGRLFFVLGAGLYEYDTNGTATKRGTVAVDGNPAQLIYNGVIGGQLGVASGSNLYVLNLGTNVFTLVLTGEATQVAYAGGFGLAFNVTNGKVKISNLNDLTTWNAGTFFQRSLFADPYQAMFVDSNNLVWLLGTDSFEVRYNSGTGTQPFVPLSGLVGRYGIVSPFAFALTGLGNFWLTRNPEGVGQLVATRGGTPAPVSNVAFATAVDQYLRTSRIDDAEVTAYQQEGHTFVCISFPSVPATWVYDIEGDNWTRRGKWNVAAGRFDLWAPRVHAFAFNRHLVGDRGTGIVSTMDLGTATEVDGTGIVRERTAPGITVEHQRVAIDNIELLMDTGVGTALGQGQNPIATMRLSVDGGRTYGNELQAGIGRIGDFRRRVYWNRLGAPPHAVVKVRVSDPVPVRIIAAYLNNFEKGA